jgi:CheY-like chemotaxis protein
MKLLIVEDTTDYLLAAKRYAIDVLSVPKGDIDVRTDYEQAVDKLSEEKFENVIIDCFFPRMYGSNDRELGKKAIEIMKQAVPSNRNSPVTKSITKVGNLLGACAAKKFAENAGVKYSQYVDNYKALEWALKGPENNQPLGIMLADIVEKQNIPFVLATSTNHHDELTQPITDYCAYRGWTLIDCEKGSEDDKATPEYWKRVFSELKIMETK